MATLNQKINTFVEHYFPDIDYSILGNNKKSENHQMALKYEYFVNSIEYYNFQKNIECEEIKQLSTGDMRGIDGCFFVLNKQLFYVHDNDETDSYNHWQTDFLDSLSKGSEANLNFYFIQSKSSKTELDKLKGFCDAVYDIFSSEINDLSDNLKVKTIKYVFEKCCEKDNHINLILKFCAIEKDTRTIQALISLPDWNSAISKNKRDLKSTKFENVDIEIKSGQDYQDKLETILSPNQRRYPIKDLTKKFIEIKYKDVFSYIGYLNLFEIKDIISKEEELDDIFFDNIRYFEGMGDENSVNSKIYKSLNSNGEIFHTLHNGITITAHEKHYNQSNGEFEIKAFSIINGCQTCNLIWMWIQDNIKIIKESSDNSAESKNIEEFNNRLKGINIPVKIIITSDNELRTKITEAANTQNPVDSIQLIAISEEAKILQKLINEKEYRNGEHLYYERLSNQFPHVGKSLKISTEDVFRAFYSTFKKSPHRLADSYGRYEKEKLKHRDFLTTKPNGQSKYDINAYYISSVMFNYLERYIRSQYVNLISLKQHLLLLLCIAIDEKFEDINLDNKIDSEFIEKSLDIISDKRKFNQLIDRICEISIKNFDMFIDNSENREKPKVKPKSYYTEEGTKKMIQIFKEKYYNAINN